MGNRTKCTPVGRGTIEFQRESRANTTATNVLHVPGLGMNLISVSQLQDKGYDVHFVGKKAYVTHSSWKKVKQIGARSNRLYRGCVLGKYAEATFPRSDSRANGVLGLIHSDICGPMSTRALSGGEYFVTFIDDHSRKTWIYFLKTKDEVFDWFKDFKALVENTIGKKIQVLRLDNGGEYIDKDFTYFCAKEGIKREWTAPYNPKQNGVAE
eukprot:PITA_31770